MTSKLLVVADLGRLKAYRMEESSQFSNPRLKLVDDWDTKLAQHLREEVTDQAGKYRKGVATGEGPSALSDGEQHNMDLERRRRAVKSLAQRIDELLTREKVDGCYLAADKRINQPILDEMHQRTRARVQKVVPLNLSKLGLDEVIKHFCE